MANKKRIVPEKVEVKTESKFLPISTRKLRLVVDSIKKMNPDEAIRSLALLNKKGARFLMRAIKTVMADAENNFSLEREGLVLKEILVNEGPKFIKRRDKHHGARFDGGIIVRPKTHLVIKVLGVKADGAKS